MKRNRLTRYGLITLAIGLGIIWVGTHKELPEPTGMPRTYSEIEKEGVLRAVTEYNAISYHVNEDTIQGFDYELLHAFAKAKRLKLEITPEMSFDKRMEGVLRGKYDVLATGTLVTSRLKDSLLFTQTLLFSKQVLVQRKPQENADSADVPYISNQLELAHQTLHITEDSPALQRLHHLIDEIADTIYIKEVKDYGPEQLLAMVAGGDIDYAVCDESIAQASIAEFPNLDIHTDIGFTQLYAWGTAKPSESLRDSLNSWLQDYTKTKEYKKLYDKYFNPKQR